MELKTPLFKKPYIELENEQEKELFKLDKDKEIKRLKEEYVMLQNASDKVEEEKDREIERLNNEIKTLLKENGNKEKVIKAQDNIIKEVKEYMNTDKNCIPKHIKDYINNLLDKENNNE